MNIVSYDGLFNEQYANYLKNPDICLNNMIEVDLVSYKRDDVEERKRSRYAQDPKKAVSDAVSQLKEFIEYCNEKSMTLTFSQIKLREDPSLPQILMPIYILLYKQGNGQERKLLEN